MRILIVDDLPTHRKLLSAMLEAEGHQVRAVSDGLEALDFLGHDKVDAVISDVLMPRMDGLRFCHELRKSRNGSTLPFIFYTASFTSPTDEKLAMEMGADSYIRKPAPVRRLLEALRQAVAHPHPEPSSEPEPVAEPDPMKVYNERLVSELKEKNSELQAACEQLFELNAANCGRARQMEESQDDLRQANEQLAKRLENLDAQLNAVTAQMHAASRPSPPRAHLDSTTKFPPHPNPLLPPRRDGGEGEASAAQKQAGSLPLAIRWGEGRGEDRT